MSLSTSVSTTVVGLEHINPKAGTVSQSSSSRASRSRSRSRSRSSSRCSGQSTGRVVKDGGIFGEANLAQYHLDMDGTCNGDNPWHDTATAAVAAATSLNERFLHRSPKRAASRVRAVHDPLLFPSAADAHFLAHTVARQAQKSLLESLSDAIASPLPQTEAHMVRVRADSDVRLSSAADLSQACEEGIMALRSTHCPGLAIKVDSGSRMQHQTMLSGSLPARLSEDVKRLYKDAGLLASDSSSSMSQISSQQEPRTIKLIQHRIQPADTLEGISVQYGVSTSHLKRLNRLWNGSEISARDCLYVPLRMCSGKYSLAYIDYINARHKEEKDKGVEPAVAPITLVEVLLDSGRDPPSHHRRSLSWAVIPYKSLQRDFSFTL